jgi:hypothetical protein
MVAWRRVPTSTREQGILSDTSPVPYVVNNDGTLSRNAGEVLLSILLAADKAGQLEDNIFVLELSIGVGLLLAISSIAFRSCAGSTRWTTTRGSCISPPIARSACCTTRDAPTEFHTPINQAERAGFR